MRVQQLSNASASDYRLRLIAGAVVGLSVVSTVPLMRADDETLVLTPPGFSQPGVAKTTSGVKTATLHITVRDRATGRPTPCRINVVGPDGNFYQPAPNRLSAYSLTGEWPKTGKGNRPGKAPFRYVGRFFYMTGEIDVVVPPGRVRVEGWKGFEYRPAEAQRRRPRERDELGRAHSRPLDVNDAVRLPCGRSPPAL